MTKRRDGSQLDLDLSGSDSRIAVRSQEATGRIMPFVDSATLQVRRDALRRVAANGIFRVPSPSSKD